MTLRLRLGLSAILILSVFVAGGIFIIRTQQRHMFGQLDEQLRATRPLFRVPGNSLPFGDHLNTSRPTPEAPVSKLYVGAFIGDEWVTLLQGQLLNDKPSLPVDIAEHSTNFGNNPITVSGENTSLRFRALLQHDNISGAIFAIALPADEAEETVERLRSVLVGGGVVIAIVLGLSTWSVERLGLRPIARLTEVADAIAKGARGLRVEESGKGTEADRLAAAFNVMLDEHEETEWRLRRFISDASHELRTPLTSIRGYLDLYSSGGFQGAGQLDDVVRRLTQEASRMQRLVEDLLLLARLDEHPQLRKDHVVLDELLRDIAADARVLQPGRPIDVELPTGEFVIEADALRLQQLVGILVSNALSHTSPDTELRITASMEADGVVIEIADRGPGLPTADAKRIFERFYRGDQSRARSTGGSGLGLAIARSIVEAHQGEISLSTAPGQGCTFTIKLPR